MVVTQTSLDAWESIQDSLGDEQLKVLTLFCDRPEHLFTDEELSVLSGKHINCITPRRGELEKSGYIVRCGQVRVQRGEVVRSVFTWKLSGKILL